MAHGFLFLSSSLLIFLHLYSSFLIFIQLYSSFFIFIIWLPAHRADKSLEGDRGYAAIETSAEHDNLEYGYGYANEHHQAEAAADSSKTAGNNRGSSRQQQQRPNMLRICIFVVCKVEVILLESCWTQRPPGGILKVVPPV